MKVWLDDVRNPPGPEWVVLRTAEEMLPLLTDTQSHDVWSLDHDLGEDVMSGYDLLCTAEKLVMEGKMTPPNTINIHSANPVGAQRMQQAILSIYKLYHKED